MRAITRSTSGRSTVRVSPSAGGPMQPQHRARLVEHVDGAVGQPVVAQVAAGQPGRALEGGVGVGDLVVAPRTRLRRPRRILTVSSRVGSLRAIFCTRRASARSFSTCLNSSKVVEPARRISPSVRTGLMRLARSMVPPVVAPAPTMVCISSMNRIGFGPLLERGQHGLQALLEVAAVARPREERAGVEGEDLGALQDLGRVGLQQPRGQPLHERGLAHAGIADEHGVVLAPPAQDLQRALQLLAAADERVELALPRALGEVDACRRPADRAPSPGPPRPRPPTAGPAPSGAPRPGLAVMPCEM